MSNIVLSGSVSSTDSRLSAKHCQHLSPTTIRFSLRIYLIYLIGLLIYAMNDLGLVVILWNASKNPVQRHNYSTQIMLRETFSVSSV